MFTENYDPCYPDQPVVDRYLPVWAKLPAFSAKPAFIWADDDAETSRAALTYSQLNSAVERMARNLLGIGSKLRRGDTVLVLASPGLRLIKLLFACQRAGLTAVPIIPPDLINCFLGPAHAHLHRALSQTRPKAAVADRDYIEAVTKTASSRLGAMLRTLHWLAVDELELEAAGNGNEPEEAQVGYVGCGPEDVYLIQYTSGSTGVPKPVLVTAGSAAHNVRAARTAYDLGPGSVVVSWLPPYHDCGLMFLLLTVVAGATCVLASPAAFLRRPRLWLELVTEFAATCTPVPSFALPLVLRRGHSISSAHRLELGSLRNLILINEPIYKSVVDEFVAAFGRYGLRATSIAPSYGLAENCTFVSTAWRADGCSSSDDHLPSYKKLLPSARLSPPDLEIEIVVVDEETGELTEDGVEGEVWVSSPSNASGYLGHPSATRQVFCGRVPRRSGPCFVRTSDRGVVIKSGADDERYLYVVGRSADVIVSLDGCQQEGQRRRVHAHYVETAAYASAPPGRLRGGCVAAFTTPSPLHANVVVVVAELQKGGGNGGDHKEICEGIRAAVWREEGVRIGRVVLVEAGAVPRTTSGKLRRGAARQKLLAGELGVVFEERYDDASVPVLGEEDDMPVMSAASWVAGASGENAMGTAVLGSASRRVRLQSFL